MRLQSEKKRAEATRELAEKTTGAVVALSRAAPADEIIIMRKGKPQRIIRFACATFANYVI